MVQRADRASFCPRALLLFTFLGWPLFTLRERPPDRRGGAADCARPGPAPWRTPRSGSSLPLAREVRVGSPRSPPANSASRQRGPSRRSPRVAPGDDRAAEGGDPRGPRKFVRERRVRPGTPIRSFRGPRPSPPPNASLLHIASSGPAFPGMTGRSESVLPVARTPTREGSAWRIVPEYRRRRAAQFPRYSISARDQEIGLRL